MVYNKFPISVFSFSAMFPKLFSVACLLASAYAGPRLGLRMSELVNDISSRIVGGHSAEKGQYPHQVSLQWGMPPILPLSHFCGGSILNEYWILTAAHCPQGIPFGSIYVKAGKHLIKNKEASEQNVVVQKNYLHEKFSGNVAPFDIALLKLKAALTFNTYVQPIKLPEAGSIPEGKAMLTGWGSTSKGGFPVMPRVLQEVELPLVDIETCKTAIDKMGETLNPLADTNVCTGPLTGGISACSGDSGGPLVQRNENGTTELIGIVSWGFMPCGSQGAPSVYTRVSAYIEWIENTISQNA